MELSRLTSEERAVPQLVEKLINYIEMHGLYTEGIYRKPGSTNKIKELKQGLDTGEGSGRDASNKRPPLVKTVLRTQPTLLVTTQTSTA